MLPGYRRCLFSDISPDVPENTLNRRIGRIEPGGMLIPCQQIFLPIFKPSEKVYIYAIGNRPPVLPPRPYPFIRICQSDWPAANRTFAL